MESGVMKDQGKKLFFDCSYEHPAADVASMHSALVAECFSVLRPKAAPSRLIRIGGEGDGAYLLPAELEGITACYSPGVNNRKTFEDELCHVYKIPCHMCDFSSTPESFSTPLIEGAQTFERLWLDLEGKPDSLTLCEWIRRYSGEESGDLLLQMDIEGAEYRNILTTPLATLSRFRVIVLELHGLNEAFSNPSITHGVLLPFLRHLDHNFLSVHVRPNNYTEEFTIPSVNANCTDVIEITFLRRDRFNEKSQKENFPVMLPHPEDIRSNTWRKEPVVFNSSWFDGPRQKLSRKKVREDEFLYLRRQLGVFLMELRRSFRRLSK